MPCTMEGGVVSAATGVTPRDMLKTPNQSTLGFEQPTNKEPVHRRHSQPTMETDLMNRRKEGHAIRDRSLSVARTKQRTEHRAHKAEAIAAQSRMTGTHNRHFHGRLR
eukprot:CAMPEP_0201268148 /NCGR_PEP_ID=MMETSP0853-20130426/27972_1 /ASSEMBLY_ACC=CAM_ASM_000640 /TAXON_ID=183588 /ORGANISM="Pseudo-nitzschia fraudulenta, Strain WWA7" /LENGTH=107 /DNA_ID=CAMNT_0047573693 /DNA_START=168 /DNA_END=488 /DNA_ORIENTATION=-